MPKSILWLAPFVTLSLACMYLHTFYSSGVWATYAMDDMFVSFRFAANLVNGNGLVWNVSERVQGFTNLGWTLLLSIPTLIRLEFRFVGLYMMVISYLPYFFAFHYLGQRLHEVSPHRQTKVCFFAAVTLCWPVHYVASWGFETSLQSCLLMFAAANLLPVCFSRITEVEWPWRRMWNASACSAFAIFVRLDSVVFLIPMHLISLFSLVRTKQSHFKIIVMISVSAATTALIFIFQRVYYGSWMPNTFHLKVKTHAVNLFRGLNESATEVVFFSGTILLFAIMPIVHRFRPPQKLMLALASAPIFACHIYSISVGGDFFTKDGANRLIAMCYPYFFLLVIEALDLDRDLTKQPFVDVFQNHLLTPLVRMKKKLYLPLQENLIADAISKLFRIILRVEVVVTGACLLTFAYMYPKLDDRLGYERMYFTAEQIAKNNWNDIALFPAGLIPARNIDRRFIDLLGFSDDHIARLPGRSGGQIGHDKYDFHFSLFQKKAQHVIAPNFIFGYKDQPLPNFLTKNPHFIIELMMYEEFRRAFSVVWVGPTPSPDIPYDFSIWSRIENN